MSKASRAPVGTRAWLVEWCTDLPVNEFGDCEPDLATYATKVIAIKGSAFALAKKMLDRSVVGEVSVVEVELTDHYGDPATLTPSMSLSGIPRTYYWDSVGDAEYVHAVETPT